MRKLFVVTAKKTCSVILCVSIILFTSSAIATTQKADNWLDEPISISFQNETLSRVLKKISKQTGVSIAYDQELSDEKVTGNYQDVKTSDAITRLFKSKNISIQVNTEKKAIIVKTFGSKNFIWVGTPQGKHTSSQMTLGELEQLHTQQYKEYKKRIVAENVILKDEGITRKQLRDMQEQQYSMYQKSIANENEFLEDEGLTRGQLRNMQEQQYGAYHERTTNNNEILEDEDITRAQLRDMQEKQYRLHQTRIADNNEILEDEGITRGQLRDMQEKQYKVYRKKKNDPKRIVNSTVF